MPLLVLRPEFSGRIGRRAAQFLSFDDVDGRRRAEKRRKEKKRAISFARRFCRRLEDKRERKKNTRTAPTPLSVFVGGTPGVSAR